MTTLVNGLPSFHANASGKRLEEPHDLEIYIDEKTGRRYSADHLPGRLERILAIRYAALCLMEGHGRLCEISARGANIFASFADFRISARRPSDLLLELYESVPGLVGNLPWGLDIWGSDGKVINVEWDRHGLISVRSFRRGPWEDDLLRAAG